MIHDSLRQRVLLFGGALVDRSNRQYFNDTWEWNGTTWRQLHPSRAPAPRAGHAIAYDAARDRVVLTGGSDGVQVFGDTWKWDGTDWQPRSPATALPEKTSSSMAYDPVRQRVVLFGGILVGGVDIELWEWDGVDWTYRGPKTSPDPVTGPALAHDDVRGRTVVFGGNRTLNTGLSLSPELWEWDGAEWTLRFPYAPRPVGRVGHAMAFDSARGVAVLFLLFGGHPDLAPALGDTWEWDGTAWRESTGPGPRPRIGHALAYDAARRRIVLFGGQDTAGRTLADT